MVLNFKISNTILRCKLNYFLDLRIMPFCFLLDCLFAVICASVRSSALALTLAFMATARAKESV